MNVLEALRIAFSGLASNRLRSGLTMLGILIGVGAVILLVAVGNGTQARVQSQIQSLGTNIIYVYPSSARGAGGVSQGFGSGQNATANDGGSAQVGREVQVAHGGDADHPSLSTSGAPEMGSTVT